MANNQQSADKGKGNGNGNGGQAMPQGYPQLDESTQSEHSLSQSSDGNPQDGRYSVAEEQNFDEQSDEARRVGRMPQNAGTEGLTTQASPSEAVVRTVREKSPETADPQPESTQDDPALKQSIERAVPPSV